MAELVWRSHTHERKQREGLVSCFTSVCTKECDDVIILRRRTTISVDICLEFKGPRIGCFACSILGGWSMKRDVCPVLQSDWTAEILQEWYSKA